jgi:hypothetical protein
VILYAPHQEVAAANLARFVDGDPTFQMDPTLPTDVSVALVTGSGFTAVRTDPRPLDDFQSFLDRASDTTTSSTAPSDASTTTTTTESFIPEPPPDVTC